MSLYYYGFYPITERMLSGAAHLSISLFLSPSLSHTTTNSEMESGRKFKFDTLVSDDKCNGHAVWGQEVKGQGHQA